MNFSEALSDFQIWTIHLRAFWWIFGASSS